MATNELTTIIHCNFSHLILAYSCTFPIGATVNNNCIFKTRYPCWLAPIRKVIINLTDDPPVTIKHHCIRGNHIHTSYILLCLLALRAASEMG